VIDVSARTARVLVLMVIPGQLLFVMLVYIMQQRSETVRITPLFTVIYITAAVIQVLLNTCNNQFTGALMAMWQSAGLAMARSWVQIRDLRSFVIRFDFESYARFEIRFVLMVRFEIFESSALSIAIRKETIGGG